jgi:uncharacterized protein
MAVKITTTNGDLLSGLFGSKLRAGVLGWLYTHSDERYFVRQLAGLLKEDSTNVSRELARLENMGLLISSASGKQKYYQADKDHSVFAELQSMAMKNNEMRQKSPESLDRQIDSRFKIESEHLASFCHRNHINKLSLYGSVLRDDFNPESDIDILVEFESGHVPGFAIIGLEKELSVMLGRRVDMRTSADLSRYFRDQVIREARVKYECTSK